MRRRLAVQGTRHLQHVAGRQRRQILLVEVAQRAERLSDGAVRVYYGKLENGQWKGGLRFEER